MRILIVSHYAVPHRGGIEILVQQLLQHLAVKGHSVIHVSSDVGTSTGLTIRGDKTHIGIPALNFLEKYAIPFPIFNPITLFRVFNRLLNNIDIVNIQGMLYMDCVFAAWMARRRDIPVVVTEYAGFVEYKTPAINFLQRLAFHSVGKISCRNSNAAVVINQQVATECVEPLLRSNTTITQIPIGVDTDHFAPASLSNKTLLRRKWDLRKPTVLFVGRMVFRKGIHLLPELSCKDFDLIVCGQGALPATSPNIRHFTAIGDTDLLELYQSADIFLLLTSGKDFPLVGLEAISCGLPLVVFNTQANHEYLDESIAIFADFTLDSLLEGIRTLLNDNAQRLQMGNAAREWAISHYDWDHTTEAYVKLFQEVCKK